MQEAYGTLLGQSWAYWGIPRHTGAYRGLLGHTGAYREGNNLRRFWAGGSKFGGGGGVLVPLLRNEGKFGIRSLAVVP